MIVGNPLIFGKNNTEKIINISYDDNVIDIFFADGKVKTEKYNPWFLSVNRGDKRLKGNQPYKFINHVDLDTYKKEVGSWDKNKWFPRSIEEGYMILNGYTYYKGMKIEDLSLFSFDIETTGIDSKASDAKILLISTTFRKNGQYKRKLFAIDEFKDEEEMLFAFLSYVGECDPNIVLGHNVMSFDLPYIGSRLPDNGGIVFEDKLSKFRKDGSQQYEYHNARIFGREVIDTFFLSIKYDTARQFPSYGLKSIEKHLGLVDKTRIEWDFQKNPPKSIPIPSAIWEQFKEYCNQDADSPIKMFDIMAPAFFYMNQSVPKTFQQMIGEASGSQLDSMMIRSYLQDGYSLPKSSPKVEFEGAISMGVPGYYENVCKVDAASLYPSIMLQYDIYDSYKDPKRNMLTILDYFRTERLSNKKLAKTDKYYDDLQNSQKILINSLYGFLGAGYLLFNYPKGAAEVTRHGREILLKAVQWATGHTLEKTIKKIKNEGTEDEETSFEWIIKGERTKYQLVNVDTDSISYTNGLKPTKEEFKAEIEELNALYPELIRFEDDGVFDKVIVIRAKNYILVKDGKIKYKGSAVTDQKKEPVLRKFLSEIIDLILNNKQEGIANLYQNYIKQCLDIKDVKPWCTKKTVTKSVLNPERANEQKVYNALQEALAKGSLPSIQEGDKVYLYQALDGLKPKMAKGEPVCTKNGPVLVPNTILKVPELWNGDHDVEHYMSRLYDTICILQSVIDIDKIKDYTLKRNKELLGGL